MALVLKDRVQETTTTTGTGTITLAGAVTGFQSFSAIGNGNTCYYAIVGTSEWEVGLGTYTLSGTTLSRDTILESSNGGSAVSFSSGTKNVFVTYPAEKSIYQNASGVANLTSTDVTTALGYTPPVTSGTSILYGNGSGGFSNVTVGSGLSFTTGTLSASGGSGMTYPSGSGIAVVVSGTSWGTTLTAPSGTIVGTTDTQTLTNKTLTSPIISSISNTGTLTLPTSTDTLVGRATTDTLTNKSLTSPTLTTATTSGKFSFGGAIDETVYAVIDAAGVALSPANGTIQTWTLGASRTPTAGTWDAGESITLMINDGTAYTITWTTLAVTWVGGTAPTLATTGFTVIELWKVGSTIYGALVGSVA
jgi:hypothetical protein